MRLRRRYLTIRERLAELWKGLEILGEGLIGRCYVVDVETGERERLTFREALDLAYACFDTAICGYVYTLEME